MMNTFLTLKNNDIDVYFIGQHKGMCKDNYIVLKDGGTTPSLGTNKLGTQIVDVLFFIPVNNFTQVNKFKKEVKDILKNLNYLRFTGIETPIITDDEKKALTWSVMYEIKKKMEG